MTFHEIEAATAWKMKHLTSTLLKFEEHGWISREGDRGFWEIGVRYGNMLSGVMFNV